MVGLGALNPVFVLVHAQHEHVYVVDLIKTTKKLIERAKHTRSNEYRRWWRSQHVVAMRGR